MSNGTVLVVGASGDVGQGIVTATRQAGWNVVAAGRNADKLSAIFSGDGIANVAGSLASDADAVALWDAASAAFGTIDAVVITVNAPVAFKPVTAWEPAELADIYAGNVLTHQIAARNFLPKLSADGLFIGIGGGTADFIMSKLAPASMAQAALRMFYRGLAKENREGPAIRELMIVSMVAGASNRDKAAPEWITDVEIGTHVAAILANPGAFPDPILQLKSREQAGQPDKV